MKDIEKTSPLEVLKLLHNSFLVQKRALGYKYKAMEASIKRFIRFVEPCELKSLCLPQDIVADYCMRRSGETPKSHANRCSDIRQFAVFLNVNGFEAYVPMAPRKVYSDFTPYIFTKDEIERIFAAVDSIKARSRYNCAEVYPVLFRVLYGCGLRISEALDLCIRDVDLRNGVLTVRNGKFNKSRLVAMSPSLTEICSSLMDMIHVGASGDNFFFENRNGAKRSKSTVAQRFREILWESGIPYRGKSFGPRLHDVRHSFCCHALKKMSDSGIDMYCALPVLSAYIGHSSIQATEQYLRLTKEFYPDITQKTRVTGAQVYPEVYLETD